MILFQKLNYKNPINFFPFKIKLIKFKKLIFLFWFKIKKLYKFMANNEKQDKLKDVWSIWECNFL